MTLHKMISYKEKLIRLLFLVICFNMIALYKVYGADHNPIYYEHEEEHIYAPVASDYNIYDPVTSDDAGEYIMPNNIRTSPPRPPKSPAVKKQQAILASQQKSMQKQDEIYDTVVSLDNTTAKLNEIISRYPLLSNKLPQTMGALSANFNDIISMLNNQNNFDDIRESSINKNDLRFLKDTLKFVLSAKANELFDDLARGNQRRESIFKRVKNSVSKK